MPFATVKEALKNWQSRLKEKYPLAGKLQATGDLRNGDGCRVVVARGGFYAGFTVCFYAWWWFLSCSHSQTTKKDMKDQQAVLFKIIHDGSRLCMFLVNFHHTEGWWSATTHVFVSTPLSEVRTTDWDWPGVWLRQIQGIPGPYNFPNSHISACRFGLYILLRIKACGAMTTVQLFSTRLPYGGFLKWGYP